MNYSAQGAQALAEMSPFGRPPAFQTKASNWQAETYPLSGGVERGTYGKSSGWRAATYPLVGFDPMSFVSENKVLVAVGVAATVGGLAYWMGYR